MTEKTRPLPTVHPERPDMAARNPLTPENAVELAVLERSGWPESRHIGAAVVTGPDGEVIAAAGPADVELYTRSAAKPLQAIASLRQGAQLTGRQVAVACGSHRGSARHRNTARSILESVGLEKSDLQCPKALPRETHELVKMARRSSRPDGMPRPNRLAFNCSGKHAAFLAATVSQGLDPAGYLDPENPVQREVVAVVEEYARTSVVHLGYDRCGAPSVVLPLSGLARAFGAVAAAPHTKAQGSEYAARRVARAMLRHPWAVQGETSSNTRVMRELGLLAKVGADGVLALGAPDGTGVAVKSLDGQGRINNLVALSLMARYAPDQVDPEALRAVLKHVVPEVTRSGRPNGQVLLGSGVQPLLG